MKANITQADIKRELIYDPDTGVFTNRIHRHTRSKLGAKAGYENTIGYLIIQVAGFKFQAHRLAWLYMTGKWPENQIDHINRKRNDNRFSNLRDATASQNIQNSSDSTKNTSGVRGVTWSKHCNKWQAQIFVLGKCKYLGLFDSKEEAAAVRKAAVEKFHLLATNV